MQKNKKLRLSNYNCNVNITITDELKKRVNALYKRYKTKDEFVGEAEGIMMTIDIDNYFLIFDYQYLTHNTIAHEVYHCVVRITEDREIIDEESQAWLCGYLTEVIYNFINKNEIKMK